MSLTSRLLSIFKEASKRAVPQEYPGKWDLVSGNDIDGINERNLLSANREWVFIAVDKVAFTVAGIRFKVLQYRRNGDDQEIFNGPLVDFLENPGPGLTGKDFIYLNTAYKELTGNAFWEKTSRNRVEPLIPTAVSPRIVNGRLTGYKYSDGANQRELQLDKVWHDRYIDLSKPYWGSGKLQKIARWADTSGFVTDFLRVFFVNGARFGGFIETEEDNEQRINLIKAGLANDHTGVRNAHKVGVLPKGAKWNGVDQSMADIEMGATDDRYRDKILAAFGVPKNILGLTQGENRATIEGTEYAFAKYTIKPIADDLLEFLNVRIAPTLDPSGRTYFAYDDFIPKNRDLDIKEREVALNKMQYKTVNEVRAEEGLPPVPGGDIIYQNPMLAPLGTPQAAPEAAEPAEEEEDTAPPAKARQRAIPGHVRRADRRNERIEKTVDGIVEKMEELLSPDVLDAAAHKTFVGRVTAMEERIETAVKLFNDRQKSQLLKDLNSITKAVGKNDLWDTTAEVALMVDVVSPILRGLLTEQAIAEYEAQGFEGTFDSGAALINRIVSLAAKRLAKSYNNTTAELIATQLNEGINAGDNLNQLTERINNVYDYSDRVRAKMVAHTESFYIANEGSREAYRQSGVVKSMRWYTAEDERVCPHCSPQNGKVIGVNETFFNKGDVLVGDDGSILSLDYRAVNVPPLHTNCRCFIRPEEISLE